MSITTNQELESRIHSFMERKLERFPEIAKIQGEQERNSLLVRMQSNVSDLLRPAPRRAH